MADDPATPETKRDHPASQPMRSRAGALAMFTVALLLVGGAAWWLVQGYYNYNDTTTMSTHLP
jgi:hypothetical protein